MSPASFPWGEIPLKKLPFMVLDVETTGLKPESSDIIEIALIPMNSSEPIMETLIDPGQPIPSEIVTLTGISDADVAGKPKILEVMPVLDAYLAEGIFVSHNVPFDWSFIDAAYRKCLGRPLQVPNLCTLDLSRRFLNLKRNALGFVADFFEVPLKNAHRAMADTQAVKDVLLKFCDLFEKKGHRTGGDLVKAGLINLNPPLRSR